MVGTYRKTLIACYLGFITQAITANFAPLLFLKFHRAYGISLGKIALIPAAFFFTQLVVDLACAVAADRVGYRQCAVAAEGFSALGLIGMAFLPDLLPDPFLGLLLSVIIYALGSGLIEVLGSPIVENCPFPNKEAVMSLLHSFYCWGSAAVILLSTGFFALFGVDAWRVLACLWAVIPLYNVYNFARCPIVRPPEEEKGLGIPGLVTNPLFALAIVLMVCAGASELSMAQWASAFAESALGLSKAMGDLLGPCFFAVTMGTSRAIYGKFGDRLDLTKYMFASGAACVCCYLLASLSGNAMAGLLGCVFCGFSVAIMWPGTISICSASIPGGGTAMFALLAMAGDLGGTIGPSLVGSVTQGRGDDLKAGMLVGTVFPLVLLAALTMVTVLRRKNEKT